MQFRLILVFGITLGLPVSASAALIINEIAWMGTSNSTSDEWIEIKNDSDSDVDLDGWILEAEDGTPRIALSGHVGARGFFLLERTDDSTLQDITADQIYTGALGNGGEVLRLKDASGAVADSVYASGGWPAGDNTTKETMQRQGSGWLTAKATPRGENVSEPEPPPPPVEPLPPPPTPLAEEPPPPPSTSSGQAPAGEPQPPPPPVATAQPLSDSQPLPPPTQTTSDPKPPPPTTTNIPQSEAASIQSTPAAPVQAAKPSTPSGLAQSASSATGSVKTSKTKSTSAKSNSASEAPESPELIAESATAEIKKNIPENYILLLKSIGVGLLFGMALLLFRKLRASRQV